MSNASPTSQIIGQKRPRTDSELREDPELWLSDGNVVLTANDDEGTIWGFKCHKSVLSKHSTVFEGMFPLRRPENAEMHDGLPLVALSDRYTDLKGLLQMLYDPIKYLPKPSDTPKLCDAKTLEVISGPLQLSHKYEFDTLRENFCRILESHWPATLAHWDKVSEQLRQLWASDKDAAVKLANPADVITLADKTGIKSVLGSAYHELHTRMRNPETFFSAADKETYEVSQVANHLSSFRSEHHVAFAQGSIYLRSAAVDILRNGLPDYFRGCQAYGCGRGAEDWLTQQFLMHTDSETLFFDPLYSLQAIRQSAEALQKLGTSPMCEDCQRDLPKMINASRHYIWNQLPYFYGVETSREEDILYGHLTYHENADEFG